MAIAGAAVMRLLGCRQRGDRKGPVPDYDRSNGRTPQIGQLLFKLPMHEALAGLQRLMQFDVSPAALSRMIGNSNGWQERRWRRARLHKLDLKMWEYEKYLESPHWQELRKRKLEQQRKELGYNSCEKCGERPQAVTRETALHIHHLTYERLGEERLEDVTIICRPCHDREHGRDAERKQKT
jgi:hypothetical protein